MTSARPEWIPMRSKTSRGLLVIYPEFGREDVRISIISTTLDGFVLCYDAVIPLDISLRLVVNLIQPILRLPTSESRKRNTQTRQGIHHLTNEDRSHVMTNTSAFKLFTSILVVIFSHSIYDYIQSSINMFQTLTIDARFFNPTLYLH